MNEFLVKSKAKYVQFIPIKGNTKQQQVQLYKFYINTRNETTLIDQKVNESLY